MTQITCTDEEFTKWNEENRDHHQSLIGHAKRVNDFRNALLAGERHKDLLKLLISNAPRWFVDDAATGGNRTRYDLNRLDPAIFVR